MKQPLISVIMPVYNAEYHLSDAIESILNQTYSELEFIIINDGSTDTSLRVIEKYKNIDARIILISQENRGVSFSRNEGIKQSKGEYIALADADDVSLPHRLEKQLDFLQNHSGIIACGSYMSIIKDKKPKIIKFPLKSEQANARLLFAVPLANPSAMMRAKSIKENHIFYNPKLSFAEDYDFWVQCCNYGAYCNLPDVLVKYRDTFNSLTDQGMRSLNSKNFFMEIEKTYDRVFNELSFFPSLEEKKLHLQLSLNVNIKKERSSTLQMLSYLDKLLSHVSNMKGETFFFKHALKRLLYKKYLVVVAIRYKDFFKIIFRKNLYLAVIYFILGKLRTVN